MRGYSSWVSSYGFQKGDSDRSPTNLIRSTEKKTLENGVETPHLRSGSWEVGQERDGKDLKENNLYLGDA